MKKIGIYVIIFIMVLLFRDNICFFYGNVLGVFKLDNNYYDAVITLKDEKIEYLENEFSNYDQFSKDIKLLSYDYKISKIIFKETYSTDKYKIQFGKDNNILVGMAITNEDGLVGKITNVDSKTSEFTTLKELNDVGVVINDVPGKLNYDYDSKSFVVTDISNYDKIYVNDEVYTSGYGTIREKIYIGKVKRIENDVISKKIYVESSVDFYNLNYILIVGDFK